MAVRSIQLGKNGVTENFILTLLNQFKTHKSIRIHVLKNARPEGKEGKQKVKEYSEKILESLGDKYASKIIGFTIILKKSKKIKK